MDGQRAHVTRLILPNFSYKLWKHQQTGKSPLQIYKGLFLLHELNILFSKSNAMMLHIYNTNLESR